MKEIGFENIQLVQHPSSEEQVFSNQLLVDIIWKHLDSQDLIRTSLVNRAWRATSRGLLYKDNKKYRVCFQIDDDNPCWGLVKFNKFLEENYGSNDNPLIFNGIQLNFKNSYKKYELRDDLRYKSGDGPRYDSGDDLRYECRNCLQQDHLHTIVTRGFYSRDENLVRENMRKFLGKILEKIKFRYFRLRGRITYGFGCPFPWIIKFLIGECPENILELHLGPTAREQDFVYESGQGQPIPRKFLCLETLSLADDAYDMLPWNNFQTTMPSLKRINRLPYDPLEDSWKPTEISDYQKKCPFHMVKSLDALERNSHVVKSAIEFLQFIQPKIENLNFERKNDRDRKHLYCEELQQKLFQLGNLVSKTLTTLTCSPAFLIFLTTHATKDGNFVTNQFPSLESLDIMGSVCVDIMDGFNLEDISNNFPKMKQVRLNFPELKSQQISVVQGPLNRQRCRWFPAVTHLVMEASIINGLLMDFIPPWLNLFGNIRHLDLVGMPFKYDRCDSAFAALMSEIHTNLALLEEITIRPADWSSFCLDHLFVENIAEVEKHLTEIHLEHLLVYKMSILDHKSLKQINIHGEVICTQSRSTNGQQLCYSDQIAGNFLVSSRTATLIRKYRPGFKFSLSIDETCTPVCTCIFRPSGFRFEHLESHAKISSYEISVSTCKCNYEIEFLHSNAARS